MIIGPSTVMYNACVRYRVSIDFPVTVSTTGAEFVELHGCHLLAALVALPNANAIVNESNKYLQDLILIDWKIEKTAGLR